MPSRSCGGATHPGKDCFPYLLKLCGTLWFAKLIKDKFLKIFQHFSPLSFCKMLQESVFPFNIVAALLESERARRHENMDTVRNNGPSVPGQEPSASRAGAVRAAALMIRSASGLLSCFAPNKLCVLFSAPSHLYALTSETDLIFLPISSTHLQMWNLGLY